MSDIGSAPTRADTKLPGPSLPEQHNAFKGADAVQGRDGGKVGQDKGQRLADLYDQERRGEKPSSKNELNERHITREMLAEFPLRDVIKTAPVEARKLTEADFVERHGVIKTLEGPVKFQVGDYLARGIKGEEWPISSQVFGKKYEQVPGSQVDEQGFGVYHSTKVARVSQIERAFSVEGADDKILHGKPGDYLACDDQSMWIIDHDIFNETYKDV